MPFDATPGSTTANSFTTVEKATTYNALHLYGSAWAAEAVTAKKENALILATRLIIEAVQNRWAGVPSSTTQALPFPRMGVYTPLGNGFYDRTIIPAMLENATAEYARRLLEDEELPDAEGVAESLGIESLKAGPVSIKFRDGVDAEGKIALPAEVLRMIRPLLSAIHSPTSVPLVRG